MTQMHDMIQELAYNLMHDQPWLAAKLTVKTKKMTRRILAVTEASIASEAAFFGERQDWLCSSSPEWICTRARLPWSFSFFSTLGNIITNDESRWQEFSWMVFDGRHAMQEPILPLPDVGDCSSGRNIFFEPGRQHYPKSPCMSTTTSFRVWESGGNSLNSRVSSSPKLEIVSKCFQLVPSNIHKKYAKLLTCWWTKNWSFELHVTQNEGVESVLSCV